MAYPAYLKDQGTLPILHEGMKNPSFLTKQKNDLFIVTLNPSVADASFVLSSDHKNSSIHFPKNINVNVNVVLFDDKNVDSSLDIVLDESANVRMNLIHLSVANKTIARQYRVRLGALSSLELNKGVFAKGSLQETEEFHLSGKKGFLRYHTLYVGSTNDQYIVTQTVTHEAVDTDSRIENYLVSSQDAKLEFLVNGKILSGMKNSRCYQQNRGVILSDNGQIRVDPKLYIDEFDVEAGHGAAIGQINEEELFYLLSRGIDILEAKQLVLSGYTEPFLSKITNESLNKVLSKQITKKIKGVR